MKKKIAIILTLFVIAVVCSAGCIGPDTPVNPVDPVDPITPVDPVDPVVPVEEYSVLFMMNYDDAGAYAAETVAAGDSVSKPAAPTRSGYTFTGWFTAAEGGVVYDFTQPVNADTMLYAQWKEEERKSSGSSHSHNWGDGVETTAPTCGDAGVLTYTCNCGQTKTESISATGDHTYVVEEVEGRAGALCSVCNNFKPFVDNAVIMTADGNSYASVSDAMNDAESVDKITLLSDLDEEVSVAEDVIIDCNNLEATLVYPENTDGDSIKILKDGYDSTKVTVKIGSKTATFEDFTPVTFALRSSGEGDVSSTEDEEYLTIAYAVDSENHLFDVYTAHGMNSFRDTFNEQEESESEESIRWMVSLMNDIDLYEVNENDARVSFMPIGGVDKNVAFEGTFDGKGHTISNLYQNGWDLGYSYGQTAGMGLFGWVGDATIKNLKIDDAEISMEAVVMGVIAGYAGGNCTFTDITITNTQIANYNWDTGGIVGQVYGNGCDFVFENINIDATNTISGHWGTWDVSAGGVIGRTADGTKVSLKNVNVACVLDVYNDVCAAYQWYAYRYSGMLVGYTKTTETDENGRTVATAPHVTCEEVTVTYGDWANYHYCQPSNVAPQFVRVESGYSTDAYYSGRHWTAGVDAEGNKMMDDTHVHAEGQAHNELIPFDQLFGGGQGVYGTATHEGVTVVYNNK